MFDLTDTGTQKLENHSRIGMDPTLITAVDAESLQSSLKAKESHLVSLIDNLVDKVWEDRPARPANDVFPLDIKYSGIFCTPSVPLHS